MNLELVDLSHSIQSFGTSSRVRHVHSSWSTAFWKVTYFYDVYLRLRRRLGDDCPEWLDTLMQTHFIQTPELLIFCGRHNIVPIPSLRPLAIAALELQHLSTMITTSCAAGNKEFLMYLRSAVPFFRSMITDNEHLALRLACENGHTEVVHELHEAVSLTREDISARHWYSLRRAGANGHYTLLKYLIETFYLEKQDFLSTEGNVIVSVCNGGHAKVFKYLCKSLNLTPDDVLCGLSSAVRGGHLRILRSMWKLGVSADHIKDPSLSAVLSAVSFRSIPFLRFLRETVGYEKERFEEERVLCEASAHGGLNMVRFLHKTVGIENSKFENSRACKLAAANGEVKVVKYFINQNITSKAFGAYGLRMAEANNFTEIAEMLRKAYGVELNSDCNDDEYNSTIVY